MGRPPRYRSWLLRCWQERSDGAEDTRNAGQVDSATWRYSLESTHDGERRSFQDLPALVAALEREELLDRAVVRGMPGDG